MEVGGQQASKKEKRKEYCCFGEIWSIRLCYCSLVLLYFSLYSFILSCKTQSTYPISVTALDNFTTEKKEDEVIRQCCDDAKD